MNMKLGQFWLLAALLLNFSYIALTQDEDDFDDVVVEDEDQEYVLENDYGEDQEYELENDYDEDSQEEIVQQDENAYISPYPKGDFFFTENFDDVPSVNRKWVRSEAKKEDIDEQIAKYDGVWLVESPLRDGAKGDLGLVLKSKAKHSAISAPLEKPFYFEERPLVVQYEVNFQNGQECGGAYLKLLSLEDTKKKDNDLKSFHDKTPYTIMFGPDKCGNDHKLHFIFRHKNPINGSIEEKHSKKPKDRLEETFKDKRPHLYTLVVNPDNTFQISVDQKIVNEGNLLEHFTPPVNPPAEIDDPEDTKPADWDEREKIPDPEARKPQDWDEDAPAQIPDADAVKPAGWLEDEPENIPDANAAKPSDWDEEMDGEWEAPLVPNPLCESAPGCGEWKAPIIDNPAYRGKWRPPLIDNPNYKGKWRPRRIANPDYFEDLEPFRMTPIAAVGFELWTMSDHILFDNLLITDSLLQAEQFAAESFTIKRLKLDKQAQSFWGRMMKSMNYKPGWWGAYFVYCTIPVTIYVIYLCRRYREESMVTRLMAYTTEHPWLWAVYIMIVGLPIVAFFIFCCGGPTPRPNDVKDAAAERKKTDEASADDAGADTGVKVGATSKSQLDAPVVEDDQEENENEEDEEEEEGEGEEDEEEEDDQAEEEGSNEESPEPVDIPNKSPRRRRTRKD